MSKRWRIEWYVPHPDHVRGFRMVDYGTINTGTTIEERTRIAAALIKAIINKPNEPTILEKVLDIGKVNWRFKTLSAYSTIVKYFQQSYPNPERCTTFDVHKFLLQLKENGKTGNTIRKYRDSLFTLYQSALKYELIRNNPVDKSERIKKSPQSLLFFSTDQIKVIKEDAEQSSPQLWLAIRMLFYCFIRPGEQRHMRINWINWEYGFIEIPGEFSKNGKTQKVSIPDHFLFELQHLKNYPNNFYVLSKTGAPGITQLSIKWLNDTHTKILDKLKIRGRYAFYSWKHTGAVMAVKAGINLKDLQNQLRHHSLDMVNEYLKNLGVMDSPDLKRRFPVL